MNRWVAGAAVPLLLLAAASQAALRPTLRPWPGVGYRTTAGSYLRPLDPGVTFTPLLTVGDTLVPPKPEDEGFAFYPLPDGIGVQRVEDDLAEIYVSHELSWSDGLGGGRVSRLLVDPVNARILAADYLVDGSEQFDRLCAATLVGPHEGFLIPRFLINEESVHGPNRGIVAAVDPRNGAVAGLPWLGRFQHENTIVLPATSGRMVAILTEDGDPGHSQLYLYLAGGETDFLAGRGDLYALRADPPEGTENTQRASMARKATPLSGRFVPVAGFSVGGDATDPVAVELGAQNAGCLNFARLEDVVPDRNNPYAFYVADTGNQNWTDPLSGRPVTGNGRVYRIELDTFDPTIVTEIRVVLDGDEGDDLYRPDNLESDDRSLWIQEDPGQRGIRPARILRYDLYARRLEPMAECAERDPQGRLIPEGTGGAWESTGIVDASPVFGPGTWLVAVQAHTMREPIFRGRGGGGQLLLMRTPVWGEKPKEKSTKKAVPDDAAK